MKTATYLLFAIMCSISMIQCLAGFDEFDRCRAFGVTSTRSSSVSQRQNKKPEDIGVDSSADTPKSRILAKAEKAVRDEVNTPFVDKDHPTDDRCIASVSSTNKSRGRRISRPFGHKAN